MTDDAGATNDSLTKQLWADFTRQFQVLRGASIKHWANGLYAAFWTVFVNALAYLILFVVVKSMKTSFPSGQILKNGDLLIMSISVFFAAIRLLLRGDGSDPASSIRNSAAKAPLLAMLFILLLVVSLLTLVKAAAVTDWVFLECFTWAIATIAAICILIATVIDEAIKDPEYALSRLQTEENS